jgi:hypothetical protein
MGRNNHSELSLIGKTSYGAISPRTILSLAPRPVISSFYTGAFCQCIDNLCIDRICRTYTLKYSLDIIISDMLFACARDTVMMLNNANSVHHHRFCLVNSSNQIIRTFQVNRS